MAKVCVFCGKKLSLLDNNSLLCGNVMQPACTDCHYALWDLSQEERAQRALDTGRAVNPELIRANLEREQQQARQARQSVLTDKTCLRCGGQMLKYGHKLFQMGSEGFFGPVARDGLFAEWLEADVLRCEACGKAEFFITDGSDAEPDTQAPQETVTCPVCGTEHSPRIGCPTCAMRAAHTSQCSSAPRKKERKPPWER